MRSFSIILAILGSVFLPGCDWEYRNMDSDELIHWARSYSDEDYKKSLSLYSMAIDRAENDAVLAEARRNKGVILIKHGNEDEGEKLLRQAARYYSFAYFLSNNGDDLFHFGLCVLHLGYDDQFLSNIDQWIEVHPKDTNLRALKTIAERRRDSQGPNKPEISSPITPRVD